VRQPDLDGGLEWAFWWVAFGWLVVGNLVRHTRSKIAGGSTMDMAARYGGRYV
jgi:hypothetical protein